MEYYGVLTIIGMVLCLLVFVRNEWVYKNRIKLIDTDHSEFDKLPSYDMMMFKFWIWDVKRFKK